MKTSYVMKAGDLTPALMITLADYEGHPLDLADYTSATITIASCQGGRRIVDEQAMTLLTPLIEGRVSYQWQPGDTDIAGEYLVEVTLRTSDLKPFTLPGSGHGKLTITERL